MERRVGLQGKRHPLRSAASPISLSQQHPRRKSRDGIWGPRGSRNLRPHRLYDPFVYWSRNFPISGGTSGSVAVSGLKCLRPFPTWAVGSCVSCSPWICSSPHEGGVSHQTPACSGYREMVLGIVRLFIWFRIYRLGQIDKAGAYSTRREPTYRMSTYRILEKCRSWGRRRPGNAFASL